MKGVTIQRSASVTNPNDRHITARSLTAHFEKVDPTAYRNNDAQDRVEGAVFTFFALSGRPIMPHVGRPPAGRREVSAV